MSKFGHIMLAAMGMTNHHLVPYQYVQTKPNQDGNNFETESLKHDLFAIIIDTFI